MHYHERKKLEQLNNENDFCAGGWQRVAQMCLTGISYTFFAEVNLINKNPFQISWASLIGDMTRPYIGNQREDLQF